MFSGVQTFSLHGMEEWIGWYNRFGSGNTSMFPRRLRVHRTRKMEEKRKREKARLAEDLLGAIWLSKDQGLVSYCTL